MLDYRHLLPLGFIRELEDRNVDEQESILSFLKN